MSTRRRVLHAAGTAAGLLTLASAWPARGQDPAPRVLRVGVLSVSKRKDDGRSLRNALAAYGWVEGKNLVFENRWGDGNAERLRALAAELVQARVDVILVFITPEAVAARQATTTIPILLHGVGADPVATGLAASLARPGGNITGITAMTAEQGVKRLELLKELLPRVSRMAWLSGSQTTEPTRRALHGAAAALRFELITLEVRSEAEISAAIAGLRGKGVQALTQITTTLTNTHAALIAEMALEQRLPYAGTDGDAERDALLGFSADTRGFAPRMAWFIDRIARGAKPADLAIERPTRFNLSVNLKTARALGLKIPSGFLAKVDRVVE